MKIINFQGASRCTTTGVPITVNKIKWMTSAKPCVFNKLVTQKSLIGEPPCKEKVASVTINKLIPGY